MGGEDSQQKRLLFQFGLQTEKHLQLLITHRSNVSKKTCGSSASATRANLDRDVQTVIRPTSLVKLEIEAHASNVANTLFGRAQLDCHRLWICLSAAPIPLQYCHACRPVARLSDPFGSGDGQKAAFILRRQRRRSHCATFDIPTFSRYFAARISAADFQTMVAILRRRNSRRPFEGPSGAFFSGAMTATSSVAPHREFVGGTQQTSLALALFCLISSISSNCTTWVSVQGLAQA
jgi:hypothetical protein